MSFMQTTMKNIAGKAMVSQAIVSLVLNGKDKGRVSDAKHKEILKLAEEMNYIPNMSAVQLRGKSPRLIGIAGHFSTVPAHSIFLWKLSCTLNENGYHALSIDFNNQNRDSERKMLNDLISRGVDGIILAETSLNESDFSKLPVPLLKVLPNIKNPDIMVDLCHGAYSLVSHLVKGHGHTKIGILGSLRICPFRKQGYVEALEAGGIDANPDWIITIKDSDVIEEKILRMIKKQNVTAFFCTNDFIAANLIKFLSANKIRVPEDVAVTGFDGLTLTTLTSPTITTAEQPMLSLADKAASIILKMIKSKELHYQGRPIFLKPEIHFGESCGCKASKQYIDFSKYYGLPTIEANAAFGNLTSNSKV